MGFLVVIFIIFCIIYFLPRILAWLLPYIIRRKLNRMAGATGQRTTSRRGGHRADPRDQRPAKHKKINPDVGEYVNFEEIEVKTTYEEDIFAAKSDSQTRKGRAKAEEQIVDVEWEDVE